MPYPIQDQEQPTYQCRHIFHNGQRCGSPALRKQNFCYYHHTARTPVNGVQNAGRRRKQTRLPLPMPEDRSAIQASLGQVLIHLANNELDPRRAGLLLYGLQVASLNLGKHLPADTKSTVEDITQDPDLGPIAPESELLPEKSDADIFGENFLRNWDRDAEKDKRLRDLEDENLLLKKQLAARNILPNLQAVASAPSPPLSPIFRRLYAKSAGGGGTSSSAYRTTVFTLTTTTCFGSINPITWLIVSAIRVPFLCVARMPFAIMLHISKRLLPRDNAR